MAERSKAGRPPSAQDLAARVARFSIRPDGRVDPAGDETIVLVPPPAAGQAQATGHAPLIQGFALAREKLAGGPVRLIANGATVRSHWPDWVASAQGLRLTELGAYRCENPVTATRALAGDVQAWLNRLIGRSLGIDPDEALFSSACSRLLQPLFEAEAYRAGLLAAHGGARIIATDPDWNGGTPRAGRERFALNLGLSLAQAWLRASAGQVRNYLRAAPSRRALKHSRSRSLQQPSPRLWLALVPDWQRINGHVIDRFGKDERFGVLLVTTLFPGQRAQGSSPAHRTDPIWPGLAGLPVPRDSLVIDQIVAPESPLELLGVLLRGALIAMKACRQLIADGPHADFAGRSFDLSAHGAGLSALLTTDIMQALASRHAVEALLKRHDFTGSHVVFAALNQVDSASPESLLRQAGAQTTDLRHGAGGESWVGQTETFASTIAVWSGTDAQTVGLLGHRAEVMPPPGLSPMLAQLVEPRRILLLSNYVHRDWASSGFPMAPFQSALVESVSALAAAQPGELSLRWRPHPDDVAALVNEDAARFPAIELAREGSLDDAFEWADVVIASPSSTVAEALARGLPCFVHVPPGFEVLPEFLAIPDERKFFRAEELVARFASFAGLCREGSPHALAPEQTARERFWPAVTPPAG